VESAEIRRRIVEYLKSVGSASVYEVAKAIGLSYGSAQWHLYVLEREGIVFSVAKGKKRIVMLKDSLDAYIKTLKVKDFFRDFWQLLRELGIESDMDLVDALKILEVERGEVASSILSIARNLYEARRVRGGQT